MVLVTNILVKQHRLTCITLNNVNVFTDHSPWNQASKYVLPFATLLKEDTYQLLGISTGLATEQHLNVFILRPLQFVTELLILYHGRHLRNV